MIVGERGDRSGRERRGPRFPDAGPAPGIDAGPPPSAAEGPQEPF